MKNRFCIAVLFAILIAPLGASARQAQKSAPPVAQEPADPQLQQNPLEAMRNFEPPADEEYLLGKGDEITIDFAGRPAMQAKLIVGPDGRITLPLAGDIQVDGLTREDAAKAIEGALADYYTNLTAQVTVTKYTANRILVLGAVASPGMVTFDGQPTLLEALTRTGLGAGASKTANSPAPVPERCAIYRGQNEVLWIDLKKLMDQGNALADLRLRRGDVVYVPSMSERFVSILGQVQRPGAIALTNTSTLASVLAEAGGFTDRAGNMPRIQIVDPVKRTSRTISMSDLLTPSKSLEVTLQPGEVIYVQESGFYRFTYALNGLGTLISSATFGVVAGGVF